MNNVKHHNELPAISQPVRDASGRIVKGAASGSAASAVSSVVAAQVAKAEKKRNEIGKAVKGLKVQTLKEEQAIANAAVEALEAVTPVETLADEGLSHEEAVAELDKPLPPVTHDEMLAALAIIARCNKQQVEQLREASAKRKKVAPEGEKVKPVKALTAEQEAKAKAKAADLLRLKPVSDLIGTGRVRDMAKAVAGIKTPDVKLILKSHNPAFKLTGLKVADLRAELMGLAAKAN